jgi:hypothetical protein
MPWSGWGVTLFFKVTKLMAELKYLPSRQIACSQNVFCDPLFYKHKTHPLPEMCAEVYQ